ncbi:Gfo/Idh/MocA family oxidoreductase [bacterium]|nr:Gfo/Idh/MocA family oxidoreductase [bacterium]
MSKLHFALVGCGRIAQRHAHHIDQVGVLKAVCDIVPEAADSLACKYGATAYYSLEELLTKEGQVDVVSVCTPNGLHAQHSIASLRAGKHVLVEKPMALSSRDCGEMIKAAERANRRLFAIKQNRFNPPVAAVKNAIDAGTLGKIHSFQLSCFWNRNPQYYENSWKGTRELDGGTLFTQFSHFVDLLYWMLGDVQRVYAMSGNFAHRGIIEFEDTGVIIMELDSGTLGTVNYTVNSYEKNMEGSLTLFGEKGTVKIGGQYLNELEYQHIQDFIFKDLPAGNQANNYGTYVGSMSNHDKVYENVVQALLNNTAIATNSYEALKTVEIIEKIYQAAGRIQEAVR